MSLPTKRRARRAAAFIASCCALLALPIASCSDHGITEPTSRLSPSGAAFSAAIALNTRVVYLGAPNSQPINFIRARVYSDNGAVIGSVDQNLDPKQNAFDFSLSVQLPGARSTTARMTLELANRGAGGEIVQYSGRIMSLQLAPGDFRQVDIDLYPGPLDNFDVRGVHIARPIADIVEDDNTVATATIDGGGPSARVSWSSLDAGIATIDNNGRILGVSPGTARVVAAVGTVADTAPVTVKGRRAKVIVTPPLIEVNKVGDIGGYTAVVVDKRGNPIANEPVLWSVGDASIASLVSTATVQAMRIGETSVTARAARDESLTGSATFRVKVQNPRVVRLEVTPPTATLRSIGATQGYTATARDSAGNVVPNVSVAWSSSAPSVASINASGVATAVTRGSTGITATVDTIKGNASLIVAPAATDLKLVGGDGQRDVVGRTLSVPFAVRTTDKSGAAIGGVPVRFSSTDGATVSIVAATSDSAGLAQAQVTLGRTVGVYHVSATADSLAGSPVTITATATAGAPYAVEIERAPSSPTPSRAVLATQPIIRIVDSLGNRLVTTLPIVATIDSGSVRNATAMISGSTRLATYDSLAIGGRVGSHGVIFSAASLLPAFTHVTIIAGAPASITAVSGATQAAQAGALVSTIPSVRVLDADGYLVPGAVVTFAVAAGNGSIVNLTATTDANGIASVGGWTLGTTAGVNMLTATINGLSTTFTATGAAGTPSSTGSAMHVSATTITAGSATPITVTIQLRDGNGNALTTSGGVVTIASTLGTVSSVVDNHDGSYTATLTAPQSTGTALLTATLGGQSLTSSATVTITPGAPSAATTTVSVGSASLNSNGTTTITITVRDAYGNIVTNVTPSDLALSSSIGTIGTVTCTNGVCTATYSAPASNGNAAINVSIGGTPITSAPSIVVSAVASAVTGLTATRGNAQVALSWTAPTSNGSAITDYFIEYKSTSGSTWTAFSHTASTATTSIVTGLTNGTSYDFRVSAVNGVGTGPASSIATATPATTAGAPTSLVATPGASQVALTWSAPSDGGSPITDYVIEYSTDGITWTTFTHTASTGTNITVTGLTNGTAYHFRVAAVNAVGTSAPSSSANATPTLGGTPHLAVTAGNNQTVVAGSAVTTAPSVKATDANNNPVSGVSVTFTVASGGGSVTGATATTDASGIATAGSWTLGTTAGSNSLTASATSYTSTTISATGAVGAASAAASTVSVSPASLTANGSATSTITIRLKDANGNNLTTGGASVTFATPSAGSIGTVTDNGDGTYTATYTAGGTAGNVTIQPKLGGTNFTNTATISLTVGTASELHLSTDAAGAVSGAAFTTQPVVQIRDASHNVVTGSTANVTMSVSSNGVAVGTSTVAAINGVATFSDVGISGTASTSYTLTFSSGSLTQATQLITPTAGAPAASQTTLSVGSTALNANGTTTITVTVKDAFGNVVTNASSSSFALTTDAGSIGSVSCTSGVCTATFTAPSTAGTANISAKIGATNVSGSSTAVTVAGVAGAPTSLAATRGNAQASLSWTAPASNGGSAITDYLIEYSSNGGTSWSTYTHTASTATSSTVTGLTNGTTYTFRVSAINSVATGSASSTATATPTTTAGAPTGLSATSNQDSEVPLTWTAPASNGGSAITDYVIEYSSNGGTSWSAFTRTASTATSSTVTGLTNGTTYTFRVSAINAVGTGTASSTTTGTPGGAPGAPTALSATRGNAQVSLSWTAPASIGGSAITDYTIEFKLTSGSTWTAFSHTASTVTSITVTGLTNGTSYDFRVSAVNGVGTGTASSIATATPATIPGAPTALAATAGSSQVAVTWTAPSDGGSPITDYVIEYSTDGTTWTTFSHTASTAASITVTGLTNGTPYHFRVSAVNAVGTSTPSSSANATPTLGGTPQLTVNGGNNQTATVGSAVSTAPSVKATDANNNPVQGVSVTFSVASGNGSVTGGTATTDASGIATVGSWTLGTTAGANSLTASATSYTSATIDATGTVGAPSATTSTLTVGTTSLNTNGTTTITVTVKDAYGNIVTSATSGSFALATDLGSIGAVSCTNGVCTATFTAPGSNGTASITAKIGGANVSGSAATVTVAGVAGAPTGLSATSSQNGQVPLSWTAPASNGGSAITDYTVEFKPTSGSTWTAFSHSSSTTTSITVTGLTNGTSYDFRVSAVNGVGTGAASSVATATPSLGGTPQLTVNGGNNQTATAGGAVATAPSVKATDANNDPVQGVSVTFSVASGNGSVTGGTATTDAGGIATVGSWTLGTTSGANSLTASAVGYTSATITATGSVGAASAATSTISASPASLTANSGATSTLTVRLKDANGNNLTTGGATVTFATPSTGSIGTVTDNNDGTYTATYTAGSSVGGVTIQPKLGGTNFTNTTTITLTIGAATQLYLSTSATGAVSGAAFTTQPVVQIRDANGNVITNSTANVTMSVSSNGQVVGTSMVAAIGGVATFADVGIAGTAGTSYTLTFSSATLTSATQLITPGVGAAAKLAVFTPAAGATNGSAFTTQPVIEIQDSFGNRTASTATVTVATSAGSTLGGTTSVTAVNGRATFTDVAISGTAGTAFTLTYTSTSLTSTTQTITPSAGTASQLAIVTSAAGASNGAAFTTQPVIELQDAFGNRTTSTASVTVGVSVGGTTVGTVTVAAVNGRATFTNVGITGTAGTSYTLTYSAPSLTSVTQSITANAGTDNQLALTTNAAGAASGVAFTTQPVVEIRDVAGARTASTSNVTMTVSAGGTVLGTTTVAAVAGVATFTDVGISGLVSGSPYTLTFASGSLTSATQSIPLTAGAASKLTVITAAAGVVSGSAFGTQPVIEIRDAAGNRTTSTANVTIATSAGSTLGGTTTVAAVNGRATFSGVTLTGTTGTTYTLTYSSSGLTAATQTIVPTGTPTKLLISTSAGGAAAGLAFTTQPVITIADASNQQTGSTAAVTMTVSSGGAIVGTSTVNAVAGVATFANVGIGGTVGSYTLTFASSGLTSATQSVTLTYGTGTQLFLLTAAAADSNGKKANTQPVIQVKDAYGNIRTGDNATQVTASVDNSAFPVGTATKTAVNGVVTYTDFGILGLAGTSYTITYASSGLTSVTQTLVPIATNSAQLRAVACTQTNSPTGNARTSIGLTICMQAQTGDVLVAMVATTNMSAASAITAPAGWTRQGLVQTSGGNTLGAVFTKTATSTDANSTATFDFGSNAGKVGGVISVFKNVVVDVASNGSTGTSVTPSDAVTTGSTATTSTIVFLVGLDPAGSLSTSGSSYFFENLAAVNGASGSKTGMFSRDGVGPSTSSTGTATSTNNSWTAFSIALKWTQVP